MIALSCRINVAKNATVQFARLQSKPVEFDGLNQKIIPNYPFLIRNSTRDATLKGIMKKVGI